MSFHRTVKVPDLATLTPYAVFVDTVDYNEFCPKYRSFKI